jgi:ribosomal protein L24
VATPIVNIATKNARASTTDPCDGPRIMACTEPLPLGAVVVNVRVTGTVVVEGVNVTVVGLKAQLLSGGRFEHMDGERVVEPVKPLDAVNVSVVDPDCPGFATVIVVGLAVIANAAPMISSVTGEVDPR